jgi:hypothetical protein
MDNAARSRLSIVRRCEALSRRGGKRCRNSAVENGTLCVIHGGSAVAVPYSAKMRLALLVDPALEVLFELLGEDQPPATRLGAVKDILDRAGYKPVEEHKFEWSGDPSALTDTQLRNLRDAIYRMVHGQAAERQQIEAGQVLEGQAVEVEERLDALG